MVDHGDAWARFMEMARARFPDNKDVAHAFAHYAYDEG
jgi:hypothetical protein